MIGIVGASGLVGGNLARNFSARGETVLGTYCAHPRPGLVPYDLRSGDARPFAGCRAVILSAQLGSIDDYRRRFDEARAAHLDGTIALARRLAECGVQILFLSSDYVFDGEKGLYTEEDPTLPATLYGQYKVLVEQAIREATERHLIFRLSKTYSTRPGEGGAYLEIYERLAAGQRVKAAYNQIFNPTPVEFVCEAIHQCLERGLTGTYHLASECVMSRYEFALSIAERSGLSAGLVDSVDYRSFAFLEPRPLNTSLCVRKLRQALAT